MEAKESDAWKALASLLLANAAYILPNHRSGSNRIGLNDIENLQTNSHPEGLDKWSSIAAKKSNKTDLHKKLVLVEQATKVVIPCSKVLIHMVVALSKAVPKVFMYTCKFPCVSVVDLLGVIEADDIRLTGHDDGAQAKLLHPDAAPMELHASLQCDGIINLERCDAILTRAFKARGTRAVVLRINSPGGSPAQSSLIYQRLRSLREQHKHVPLLVFVEDYAASGGYFIASAADEIIADPSSLVGSIGVVSSGFGYVKSIKRKGIERRLKTAGKNKRILDPWLPERSHDLAIKKKHLQDIHNNFIDAVKEGRGDRLKPEEAAELYWNTTHMRSKPTKRQLAQLVRDGAGLFDGSSYTGQVGYRLGLVDQVGEMRGELRKRFGRFVRIRKVQD